MARIGRILASLSLLALGAHFLRSGSLLGPALCLALLALAWVVRAWAIRLCQAGLALGALEWGRTLWTLMVQRQAMGAPWHRLAAILGAVAFMAALAAVLIGVPQARRAAGPANGI